MSPAWWNARTCSLALGCVVQCMSGSVLPVVERSRRVIRNATNAYAIAASWLRLDGEDRRCDTMVAEVAEYCVGVLGGVCDALFTASGYSSATSRQCKLFTSLRYTIPRPPLWHIHNRSLCTYTEPDANGGSTWKRFPLTSVPMAVELVSRRRRDVRPGCCQGPPSSGHVTQEGSVYRRAWLPEEGGEGQNCLHFVCECFAGEFLGHRYDGNIDQERGNNINEA